VTSLWKTGKIQAKELWTFAYEDGKKTYFPRAIDTSPFFEKLPEQIWLDKYNIITKTYGFNKGSWEAETTPLAEAFWQFKKPEVTIKNKHEKRKRIEHIQGSQSGHPEINVL